MVCLAVTFALCALPWRASAAGNRTAATGKMARVKGVASKHGGYLFAGGLAYTFAGGFGYAVANAHSTQMAVVTGIAECAEAAVGTLALIRPAKALGRSAKPLARKAWEAWKEGNRYPPYLW
jgi:hypothetical protein